jgi:hypothetical protein
MSVYGHCIGYRKICLCYYGGSFSVGEEVNSLLFSGVRNHKVVNVLHGRRMHDVQAAS